MNEEKQLAIFQSIWDKATRTVQSKCEWCDVRRNYVCEFHNGWADGFEVCLTLFEIVTMTPEDRDKRSRAIMGIGWDELLTHLRYEDQTNGGAPSND